MKVITPLITFIIGVLITLAYLRKIAIPTGLKWFKELNVEALAANCVYLIIGVLLLNFIYSIWQSGKGSVK